MLDWFVFMYCYFDYYYYVSYDHIDWNLKVINTVKVSDYVVVKS